MRLLHEAPLDPRSRFIRLVLSEKGLSFELREERSWERAPEFLTLNPAGETPVLREAGGLNVPGATVIAEYLEELYPEHSLMGGDAVSRVETRRLLGWFLDKLSREVTEALREEKFLKRVVYNAPPDVSVLRAASANLSHHLDYIAWLAEHRRWLGGERMTLVDLAAAAQLSVLDYLGSIEWPSSESEARGWYARMKSRPSMREILSERMSGVMPPRHYSDPDF
ncbi:MAG: glutathione S-transferase family protein [Alphaproteobacteria bacterium]|nr:glutathione S-transferase family protein [Alphaproteobacteria bacterium]MDA8010690.1 glutathione S-transferase family protein [Alphaproteobacteria bacterium]